MPFNSKSYHRNKAKKGAMALLADARAAKQRGIDPTSLVKRARLNWNVFMSYRRMDRIDHDMKKLRNREMTYAEFMQKWDPRKEIISNG
jgi:hypothetical protein